MQRYGDAWAALLIIFLGVAAEWPLLVNGTVIAQDMAAFYYPWFSLLGERLRSGDLPGWNPYIFSGTPFAADPQSGWMYLPAMILFALLPLASAAKGFMSC